MQRDRQYIEEVRKAAECITFLNQAHANQQELMRQVETYSSLLMQNSSLLLHFPALCAEMEQLLVISQFNYATAPQKVAELQSALEKLTYIGDMLDDLKELNSAALEQKLNLSAYKSKFNGSSEKLIFRSIDTLHFEMKQFEEKFKVAAGALNNENQKRQKVKSLINQDASLFAQFPKVKMEVEKIADGTNTGALGPDYIITNYPAIKNNLGKLNEFSTYFSRLSKDYLAILNAADLKLFPESKGAVTLQALNGEYMRLNTKYTEMRNRMTKLDTLRNALSVLKREVPQKLSQLQPHHQQYVQTELSTIDQLLGINVTLEFELAESKINTVRELLKKEFKSNDERVSLSFTIRQNISRFEGYMFDEDAAYLRQEAELYANGGSQWRKEDFDEAIQSFIRGKNETVEGVRSEFQLYLSKNRDYKNKLEKIANTKSSKTELENLMREMGSFRIIKTGFYKFLK